MHIGTGTGQCMVTWHAFTTTVFGAGRTLPPIMKHPGVCEADPMPAQLDTNYDLNPAACVCSRASSAATHCSVPNNTKAAAIAATIGHSAMSSKVGSPAYACAQGTRCDTNVLQRAEQNNRESPLVTRLQPRSRFFVPSPACLPRRSRLCLPAR